MKTFSLFLLTVLAACAVDETIESTTEEGLSKEPIDPIDPTPAPPPAPPPPESSSVVRISSSDLDSSMKLFLGARLVTVDTTQTSEAKPGPLVTVCTFPNEEAREAATAECRSSYVGSALFACLQQVNIDFPNISECSQQHQMLHSYLDFPPSTESQNVRDVVFNVSPIVKDTYAGSVTFDVNYIRSSDVPISASFGPNKTASVWIPLTSNYPALPCRQWWCPNVEMSNMRVLARFTDLRPGAAYSCAAGGTAPNCTGGVDNIVGAKLNFSTPRPTFYFDRNLANFPDFVLTALVDVDAVIRDAAEGKLLGALTTADGHAAVSRLLTEIALRRVRATTHPTARGFARIRNTWYDAGQLVIEYDWY